MFPVDSKILIVDDSSFSRTMVKNSLKDLGYWKMLEAASAKEAAELLQEPEQAKDPVHLMIVDIHMPELTGLDLVRWVRGREKLKEVPIIILTSSQERSDVLEAGRMGVTHFMIKPFDTTVLQDRLATAWQRHGQKYYDSVKKD